jgi:repressor LexA
MSDSSADSIYAFIAAYWVREGYGPTLREVAAGVGLASVSSAAYHVAKLERAGLVTRRPNSPRTLRIAASATALDTQSNRGYPDCNNRVDDRAGSAIPAMQQSGG